MITLYIFLFIYSISQLLIYNKEHIISKQSKQVASGWATQTFGVWFLVGCKSLMAIPVGSWMWHMWGLMREMRETRRLMSWLRKALILGRSSCWRRVVRGGLRGRWSDIGETGGDFVTMLLSILISKVIYMYNIVYMYFGSVHMYSTWSMGNFQTKDRSIVYMT